MGEVELLFFISTSFFCATKKKLINRMFKLIQNGKVCNRQFDPWLQIPLSLMRQKCRNDDISIVVEKTSPRTTRSYKLKHRKAKRYVILEKKGNFVSLLGYERLLPNLDLYIVPPFEQKLKTACEINDQSLAALGNLLHEFLCHKQDYYQGLKHVLKLPVASIPTTAAAFYGGKMVDCIESTDTYHVTLESGYQFTFPKAKCQDKVLKQHHYLIMNQKQEFDTVPGIEFNDFFRQI